MKIAYSIEYMRPGCVLLQAALGCEPSIAHPFPTESWIVGAGAETLRVFNVTETELQKLVQMTREKMKPLP